MGEVYLAEDIQTGRKVALKVLPEKFMRDDERVRRFQQEARTTLALNHPNIVTIYEIGEANGSQFIASEFIEGETLRLAMAQSSLTVLRALDLAIQIASALVAAHDIGIIHRDIKPENIMLRPDGYVKVLDFGLAKLTESDSTVVVDTNAPTVFNLKTAPGMVVGTVNYMSPEQVRGNSVDARTDIWSLGVVLYEMITGNLPFRGVTSGDVIAAILEKEPPPLARYSREAPEALEEIVTTALAKNREERYQTATQLAASLKRLKQKIELAAEVQRSQAPDETPVVSTTRTLLQPAVGTGPAQSRQSNQSGANVPTSTAGHAFDQLRQHKLAAGIVMLVLVLGLGAAIYLLRPRPVGSAIDSIAVLPFANQSGDPNAEYLSDGITESLIYSLSQLPGLKVMASSSVFRYKGRTVDAQSVGSELNVRAVLSGKVVQRGDSLSISAELVDTRDSRLLWGEKYNRKFGDILAVQEEISREISQKLQLRLSGDDQQKLAKRYTQSTEAYELYLKGNYLGRSLTEQDLTSAIENYQQAISIDPNYAQAYAGMATAYMRLGNVFGFRSPKETFPAARVACKKALELDDTLSDAHYSLATYKVSYEWDFPGAGQEFKRSIELNPNNPNAHTGYGTYLQAVGDLKKALEERKLALDLDPLSPFITANVGYPYYYDRQYDQAIEYYRKALEIDPNFSWSYLWLGQVYLQRGMYDEAIINIKRALALSDNNVRGLATLGYAYAVSNRRAEAENVIADLREQGKTRYVSPYFIATVYAGLDDRDQTFAWLEKAFDERYPYLVLIRLEPVFDKLHSDPRFVNLTKRIGLP